MIILMERGMQIQFVLTERGMLAHPLTLDVNSSKAG
jgi:hypothetical protein